MAPFRSICDDCFKLFSPVPVEETSLPVDHTGGRGP